jgi:hypothetical protein
METTEIFRSSSTESGITGFSTISESSESSTISSDSVPKNYNEALFLSELRFSTTDYVVFAIMLLSSSEIKKRF